MEKDFRLFVKNLPLNAEESKLKELFENYVTVNKIDLKEKKDLDNKVNKFAFINVTTTEKDLHKCFGELNGERIDGFQIIVELAKESFLERLKRERSENKLKAEKPINKINEDCPKIDSLKIIHSTSKPKHQKFSEVDLEFSLNDSQISLEESPKEKKKKEQKIEEHQEIEESYTQEILNYPDSNNKSKKINDFVDLPKENKSFSIKTYTSGVTPTKTEVKKKLRHKLHIKSVELTNNKSVTSTFEEPVINESEKKRLTSLQEKRKAFKQQEQAIRDALKLVDNKKLNNKIVFDDDIELEHSKQKNENNVKKKNALFDSDDEDQENFGWNEKELDAKASVKKKLLKLQTNYGNDKRFVLDERFLDDDEKDEIDDKRQADTDDQSIVDERKWQLDLLGDVLGKSVLPPMPNSSDVQKKKNRMIRYDPTASNHQDFEVTIEKQKQEKPTKKKRKISISEVKEQDSIPVSKELFYDVSENLTQSLRQSEGFSLLKTFGRDTSNADDSKPEADNAPEENGEGFQFNFRGKNPFKYDSSDNEDDEEEVTNENTNTNSVKFTMSRKEDDRLFFTLNDPRFREAELFFKTQSTCEEGAFKNRRRELKEIVRSKIRNNLKKTVPWNRKKIRRVQKKRK